MSLIKVTKILPGEGVSSKQIPLSSTSADYWDNRVTRSLVHLCMRRLEEHPYTVATAIQTAEIWTAILSDAFHTPSLRPSRLDMDVRRVELVDQPAALVVNVTLYPVPRSHEPMEIHSFIQVWCLDETADDDRIALTSRRHAHELVESCIPPDIRRKIPAIVVAKGHKMAIYRWETGMVNQHLRDPSSFWNMDDFGFYCLGHDHNAVELLLRNLRREVFDAPSFLEPMPPRHACCLTRRGSTSQ
ncbi:uncharacterized protein BP01DRAFT_367269 [Aspergillus saccharolyticus JOP 1030-1]|uniref:Uncharacterized protein n=1 Tax=Aspergillus saccharolyticus JOP 1030-1 TaxID=1450539 RepID=A0A318Z841_9EURO|nr:hypothetical protein BP01DRAFT_367269 [Aspergillus saccharolyticus JOP 1030-1]PYH43485.1 hypothetical protein BP01DRAFT_367269 [Aspergillus saccharolyticus JOP 1030-1]